MEEHFDQLFYHCVRDLTWTSVPGHCELAKYGSTNAQVFDLAEDGTLDESRFELVKQVVYLRLQVLQDKPVADPIKLFIKSEFHKREKILNSRFRLISSVSLIDGLVDRMLFIIFAKKLTGNFANTGICIGYNPQKGGHRFMHNTFPKHTEKLLVDQTAFDWTYKPWMANVLKNVINDLNMDPHQWWTRAVDNRFKALFDKPKFVFSDGERIDQPIEGVMKSGCYLTIIANSIAVLSIHYLSSLRSNNPTDGIILVQGDDAVQDLPLYLEEYKEAVKTCGVLPKFKTSKSIEFAGFRYENDIFVPEYRQKHLVALKHLTSDRLDAEMTLNSYLRMYTYEPTMLAYIRSLIAKRNLPKAHLSDRQLKWFDA
ncbi:hypothetical protein 3 [Sanxia sobemo-like virus 1]|uniref:hypothetical protein 3 n=1 Tax=Sanxia sobemo-like virus 1 TaxID=1923380 RepID=UPI00090A267D|nr:hypothetical protein 3 [Sanxia sobemo-like virus 1]APG75867.1 hypothetical protein 3 [Sanxia sobemo-like virus 1]